MRGVLWTAVVLGTLVSSVSAGLAVPVVATEEVVEGRDLNGHGQIPLGSTLSSSSSSSSSASSSPLEFDQSQSPHLGEEASSTIFDNTPNPQHPETDVPYHDQKPTVIIQSNTDTHTDADTKEKESSAQILKSQISELDRLRDAYLQLENELKNKTERVNSMSKSLCGPKSIWECETRPFCMLSVLFGWSRKPNENARMGTGMRIDVGQCLNRLEKLERIQNGDDGRKGEIPARLQEEYAKGKERSFMRRVLCELGIVLLGSMMVIGIGCMLRGSAKAEELPLFEPRQAEHDDRRTGFWRRLFRVSVVLRRSVRGPRGDDEEADGEDEKDDVERVREEQVVIHEEVLAPPRPRHYARREIEEHIESWGMGVQQEMMNEYSSQEQEAVLQAEEQEGREGQSEEDDCESEQDSEPGSVDSMQGVTMEDEIASFRDAFGLVADMLAAVEQRRR